MSHPRKRAIKEQHRTRGESYKQTTRQGRSLKAQEPYKKINQAVGRVIRRDEAYAEVSSKPCSEPYAEVGSQPFAELSSELYEEKIPIHNEPYKEVSSESYEEETRTTRPYTHMETRATRPYNHMSHMRRRREQPGRTPT